MHPKDFDQWDAGTTAQRDNSSERVEVTQESSIETQSPARDLTREHPQGSGSKDSSRSLAGFILSAALAWGKPMEIRELAEKAHLVGLPKDEDFWLSSLQSLKRLWDESSGFPLTIHFIGQTQWALMIKPDYSRWVQPFWRKKPFRLTPAQWEVLAIVAYEQPVIKAQVDAIRQVESGHVLRQLMELDLIRIGGRSDLPGKPPYYETTPHFLEVFQIRHPKELPSWQQLEEFFADSLIEDETDSDPWQPLQEVYPLTSWADEALWLQKEWESLGMKLQEVKLPECPSQEPQTSEESQTS